MIVPNSPGDCFSSTDTLYRVWSQRMDGLEFDSLFPVELTPGGVDSACHPFVVSEMNTSVLDMQ